MHSMLFKSYLYVVQTITKSQQGSSIIYVVVAMLIMSALGVGIVQLTTSSTFSEVTQDPYQQARHLAVSGFEYAKILFKNDDSLLPDSDSPPKVYEFSLTDNNSKIRLEISYLTNNEFNLSSTGIVHSGTPLLASSFVVEGIYRIDGNDDVSFNFSVADVDEIQEFINNPDTISPEISRWGADGQENYEKGDGSIFQANDGVVLSNVSTAGGQGQFIYTPIPRDCDEYIIRSVARTTLGAHGHGYGVFFDALISQNNFLPYPGYLVQFDPGFGSDGAILIRRRWGTHEDPRSPLYLYNDYSSIPQLSQNPDWWYDLHYIKLTVNNVDENTRRIIVTIYDLVPDAYDMHTFTNFYHPNIWMQRTSFSHEYNREFDEDDTLYTGFRTWGSRSYFHYLGIKMMCDPFPSPIAEYRFDECTWNGSPGEVEDSSNNELHGSIFGTPVLGRGKINNSASFINNQRMGIQLPNNQNLKPQKEITISAWIKRNAVTNEGLQNIYHFGNWQQYLRLDQTSDIVFGLTSKGTLRASGVADNLEWNHVAATYDGNKMSIYFNGELVASRLAQGVIEYTGNQYIIGNVSTGQNTSFNGKIDELKIFDVALAPGIIYELYYNELNGSDWDGRIRDDMICPAQDDFLDFLIDENVFIYGSALEFRGNNVIGHGATIVLKSDLSTSDLNQGAHINVSNIYFDGPVSLTTGSASLGSSAEPGSIFIDGDAEFRSGGRHIYGDVHINGDLHLSGANIHGNIFVNGNVNLYWGAPTLSVNSNIYYTGQLSAPNNYNQSVLNKCIPQPSVPGFEIPDFTIPGPRPDQWYADRGYVSSGRINSNLKIFANNYSSTNWRPTATNVVIVSTGDITITGLGGSGLIGVLYAPYGKVTFGGSFFEGTVIARDGFFVTSGGTNVTFKNINDYFDSIEDIPISSQ